MHLAQPRNSVAQPTYLGRPLPLFTRGLVDARASSVAADGHGAVIQHPSTGDKAPLVTNPSPHSRSSSPSPPLASLLSPDLTQPSVAVAVHFAPPWRPPPPRSFDKSSRSAIGRYALHDHALEPGPPAATLSVVFLIGIRRTPLSIRSTPTNAGLPEPPLQSCERPPPLPSLLGPSPCP